MVCISNGWESDVYSFVLQHGVGSHYWRREELVLRIYSGDFAYYKSAHEFHAMVRLAQAGYPVPRVLLLERECSPFGKPFVIMEKVAGQLMWPLLFRASGERCARCMSGYCI